MPAKRENQGHYVVSWRRRAKGRLMAGFGNQCGICGYSKCSSGLTFHHMDPTEKEFSISGNGIPRSWKRMVDEIKKCVLLCRNCHAEVHAGVAVVGDDVQRYVDTGAYLPMRERHVVRKKIVGLKSKLKQNPTPCAMCGELCRTGDKYCSNVCRSRGARKIQNRPEGKYLKELVRMTSRVAVAARFGVSETAVRKWIRSDSLRGIY